MVLIQNGVKVYISALEPDGAALKVQYVRFGNSKPLGGSILQSNR